MSEAMHTTSAVSAAHGEHHDEHHGHHKETFITKYIFSQEP